MIELDLHTLRENPTWLAVLFAYQTAIEELAATEAEAAAASRSAKRGSSQEGSPSPDESSAGADPDNDTDADPESDVLDDAESEDPETTADDPGTKRRRGTRWVTRQTIEGVDPAELSKIHGRLIAYGFLKCDLTDRSAGVVYQLTAEAKQALAQVDAGDSAAEDDEVLIDVA